MEVLQFQEKLPLNSNIEIHKLNKTTAISTFYAL